MLLFMVVLFILIFFFFVRYTFVSSLFFFYIFFSLLYLIYFCFFFLVQLFSYITTGYIVVHFVNYYCKNIVGRCRRIKDNCRFFAGKPAKNKVTIDSTNMAYRHLGWEKVYVQKCGFWSYASRLANLFLFAADTFDTKKGLSWKRRSPYFGNLEHKTSPQGWRYDNVLRFYFN